MNNLKTFEKTLIQLFSIEAPLVGKVSKQYNTCGNPKCRCKDKNNPKLHGPRYQLSYTLNGKGSSMTVREEDYDDAKSMNDNHIEMRMTVKKLSEYSVALCRELGVSEAYHAMNKVMQKVKTNFGNSGVEFPKEKPLVKMFDSWKEKALQHQASLEKNRIKIRDLEKSRKKWRDEALDSRREKEDLQLMLDKVKKENQTLDNQLGHINSQLQNSKKNR